MSEKLYSLGDLLKKRNGFIAYLNDKDKDRVHMNGAAWTDLFLLWLAQLEEEDK